MKERIKIKAEELFRRLGIRSVTMDDIANQLGISKKTIYLYYADKDEIVDAVITNIISVNQACCTKDRAVASNAIHEVFLAMEMIQEMFQNMNPSILFDLERSHPVAFKKFLQHKYTYLYQMMKENIVRGITEELYRPEIIPEVIAKMRLETMMLSFNMELFPTAKFNLIVVEQQLIEHYLYGLATLKGHRMIIKYQNSRLKTLKI